MRGLALLLTLTLCAPALAGCLDYAPLATILGDADEISAMDARDAGDGEAKAWQRDARLVNVMGFEARRGFDAEEWGFTANASADPSVGNGLATAWGLVYASESAGEQYFFVVHADGTITDKHKEPLDDDEPEAYINGWRVDSDDAVGAARANATFAASHDRAGANRTYGLFLFNSWEAAEAHEDGNGSGEDHDHEDGAEVEEEDVEGTYWGILLSGEKTMTWAVVNASSGDVVAVASLGDMFGDWGDDWGGDWSWGGEGETTYEACHGGRLDANNPEDAHRLPVTGNATHARVVLRASKALPTDQFSLVVTSPSGEEVATYDASSTRTSAEFEWEEDVEERGEYTVTLAAGEATVAVDYRLELWAGVPGDMEMDWDYDWGWTGGWMGECP